MIMNGNEWCVVVLAHPTNHDAIGDRDFMDAETMSVIAIGGQLYRSIGAEPLGSPTPKNVPRAYSIDPVPRVNFN